MMSLLLAAGLATTASASTPTPAPVWQDSLQWHGTSSSMSVGADGDYMLSWPYGQRSIPAPASTVNTASTLFNGLYAMAQDDLKQDSVSAIRDGAFDHGRPIPCHCFETGLKWPYVWTRDLSYAVDLGLWRFDAARARNGLAFKLSNARVATAPQGLYVMQDTGSGGSWPISTDRIVWFLGARHLLDNKAFASDVTKALVATLDQDRQYIYDPRFGLYRGETSFMDWREQSYPAWTANNVVTIAQSFALSTNVLHYQALALAAKLSSQDHDSTAAELYKTQADALKASINQHFWRADRGMYMSYIGGDGTPYDTYDLLGTALAVTSGVAQGKRARQALANYPTWPAGSPVMWPERSDQPIYHNRAIWPFVSAYALRAARAVKQPARIAHEIESVMRGAALYGSNMENYELLTQGQHLDDGKLSGPVVNSPRQLWSVAAYLDMVTEGVFGLTEDGKIHPELPVSLVPMLFGQRESITLQLADRRITVQLPPAAKRAGNLLVADTVIKHGSDAVVTLKAIEVSDPPLRTDAPLFAEIAPAAPKVVEDDSHWQIAVEGKVQLYVNGHRAMLVDGHVTLPKKTTLTCFSATRVGGHGLESLHSPDTCVGNMTKVNGDWPRTWTAPKSGTYRLWLDYSNDHGPINTGITAAVKVLHIRCGNANEQRVPMAMPHSVAVQHSTWGQFTARAGDVCNFDMKDGFNMSYLAHFAHFTGGAGGASGPLNKADIQALVIAPVVSTQGNP